MTEMICGAVGAILVLAAFAAGCFAGWTAKGRTARDGGAEGTDHFAQEQRAFEEMLRYDRDTAYGVNKDLAELLGGDGT